MKNLENIINDAWEKKDQVNKNSDKSLIDTINKIISEKHEKPSLPPDYMHRKMIHYMKED